MMADAGGEGAEMAVPPHGDEAHTGGGGGGAKQKIWGGIGKRVGGTMGGFNPTMGLA